MRAIYPAHPIFLDYLAKSTNDEAPHSVIVFQRYSCICWGIGHMTNLRLGHITMLNLQRNLDIRSMEILGIKIKNAQRSFVNLDGFNDVDTFIMFFHRC
jgi:hypothetical protein